MLARIDAEKRFVLTLPFAFPTSIARPSLSRPPSFSAAGRAEEEEGAAAPRNASLPPTNNSAGVILGVAGIML